MLTPRRSGKRLRVTVVGAVIGMSILATGTTMSSVGEVGFGAQAEAATSCQGGSTTLHLLEATGNPPFKDVIAGFEKQNPCIKVAVSTVPFGNLNNTIEVDASSPDAPDVFESDGPDVSEWAAKGIIMPLTKYVTWKSDIVPATLTEESYDGQIYSPGLEQSAVAMFYNATLLDKHNIHPPKTLATAWTWPQALKAMQACQIGKPGHASVWGLAASNFGNGTPGFSYRDLVFARSEGSPKAAAASSSAKTFEALSPDKTSVSGYVNTPEAIEGDRWYQDLYNKWGVTPKAGSPNQFVDGQACFDLQGSYDVSAIDAAHVKFKWGVTPLPYFKTPITQTGSETIVVSSKTKHTAAAVKFAIYVTDPAGDLQNVKDDLGMPVVASLYKKLPEWNTYPLDIFKDELFQWGEPRPPTCHFLQYDQIMTSTLRDIAYGGNVKSNLDSAASQLDPILASSC